MRRICLAASRSWSVPVFRPQVPRLPLRLVISLLYLKHAFNESDEGVVERWAETPTWQYFSGMDYFEHRWPCDPSQLVHLRKALGEEGVEVLLQQTINVAITLKLIAKSSLAPVIVDSTLQHKAIAYPTDAHEQPLSTPYPSLNGPAVGCAR